MNYLTNRAISAYATANSMLPPLIAVVRLYEKALLHLHHARDAARERKFERHYKEISRAMAIFAGLDAIIDDKHSVDVAATLRRFYRTLIVQAGAAAARKDPVAATDAIIRQVSTMLEAWRSIAAERGMGSRHIDASAKGPHASAIGRPTDHAPTRVST